MNNNYNSKNKSDKSINNNDNDNNSTFLILVNNVFTSCLNEFKLMFLFIEFGNLFQTEGPIYERFFCPMVVLRKGTLSLA